MKNWKTTISGIFSLVLAGISVAGPIVSGQVPDAQSLATASALIATGIGLIAARDAKATPTATPVAK